MSTKDSNQPDGSPCILNHILISQLCPPQALILGKADPKLSISRKVYELIYELNNICPRILLTVLPQLEFKLKSTEESERLGSVSLLARMFSEKGSSLAQKHR